MTQHLSARLSDQADQLRQLAHLAGPLDARLSNALIYQAARLSLASLAATTLERDLRTARHALDEIAAEAAEEERAITQRHACARTIAAIMAPVMPAHTPPHLRPDWRR